MESIFRDVKSIESDERRIYESIVGHSLQDNQRVVIRVIELGGEPDEASDRETDGHPPDRQDQSGYILSGA